MCDTLCVLGSEGTLFAKSSDRPVDEVQVVESFDRRAGGGTLRTQYLTLPDLGAASFIGGRPTWLWGVEHGVNEHRVAIGNERVWTVDDASSQPQALIGMDLVRLALERAPDADTAVEVITGLLDEHGQGGIADRSSGEAYFSSFLIADPAGAWVLETSGRTWVAERVDALAGGAAISNRLTLAAGWTRCSPDVPVGSSFQQWADPTFPVGHADHRIEASLATATRRPAPGPRDLAAVLRHHGSGPWGAPGSPPAEVEAVPGARWDADGVGVSICMHLRGWEATAGSMIAELPADPEAPLRAWAAVGNPCVSVFVPLFPTAAVPGMLADPATWAAVERLRSAVEHAADADRDAGIDALREVRAELGPLEAALWDEADEVAAKGPEAHRAFADRVPGRLDAALSLASRRVAQPIAARGGTAPADALPSDAGADDGEGTGVAAPT